MHRYLPRAVALTMMLAACSGTASTTTTVAPTTTLPAITTTTAAPTTTTAPPSDTGDDPTSADLAGAIFELTTLNSFRTHTEVELANDPEGTRPVIHSVIDSAYTRNPDAVSVEISINDTQNTSIIGIEGRYFLNEGTTWKEEALAQRLLSLASPSLLAPETVAVILPLLDEIGDEEVAGRAVVHYQGGPAALQSLINATDDPTFASFTEIEYATIDLWVDKAGFLARAIYEFGGVRAAAPDPEYYTATFEILEYDGDVTIESPLP